MAINNEAVLQVTENYVKQLQDVRVDENPKWFPPHDDKVVERTKFFHETLGEFWSYGKVR